MLLPPYWVSPSTRVQSDLPALSIAWSTMANGRG
jgi:hypothetical protein